LIDTGIRQKFPSIPADFELKPVRARHIQACGTIHDFKVLKSNRLILLQFLVAYEYFRLLYPAINTPKFRFLQAACKFMRLVKNHL
jgi:hypothetical protein